MGNQLDRITHLSYSELPTGDPSGLEKDELRVGVAYFFSDEEDDLDERGRPERYGVKGPGPRREAEREDDEDDREDGDEVEAASTPPPRLRPLRHPPQLLLSEAHFSAFRGQECIFSKRSGDGLSVCPAPALPALCQPGDLLELLCLGAAEPRPPQWAVYVGDAQIVHLHQGQIRLDSLRGPPSESSGSAASAGNVGRVVSSWYRYRPLGAELVVQNARSHLGLKSPEIGWTNSESFAAWCRFGKREFKAGGELPPAPRSPPQPPYYLQVHLAGRQGHTARFHSLEDLIREKRRIDAGGDLRVGRALAIVGDGTE